MYTIGAVMKSCKKYNFTSGFTNMYIYTNLRIS